MLAFPVLIRPASGPVQSTNGWLLVAIAGRPRYRTYLPYPVGVTTAKKAGVMQGCDFFIHVVLYLFSLPYLSPTTTVESQTVNDA